MLNQGDKKDSFDFTFLDRDKINYRNYHERLMGLLRVGGVAVFDNTLWGGTVAMHGDDILEWRISVRQAMIELNEVKEEEVHLIATMANRVVAKSTSPSKGLLQSNELYQYVLETTVYPREPKPLEELRSITTSHPRAMMGTAPDAGQMISMLLKVVGAKRTIEIGVFTGYSLLLTALTIPDDGKIIAVDVDRDAYEMGLSVIKKAGVKHKINFIQSEALPILDQLLEDKENEGTFDFGFVDADKVNYWNYHERLMKLLKVGGIAAYDNTLWGGSVAMPEEEIAEWMRPGRQFTIQFNELLAQDRRVDICLAPLGDGITICRRIC
ncbi:hypothetical protein MLD38_005801 [Melastoma candidum]|uniref:Uncharacterized protein n=1 Tax=Melastoma candidum TaxID=119954 RepID=A0ACB9RQ12_9MYRT|nr:hypothetical protein MLD38_005801 [Melastoma candidum]